MKGQVRAFDSGKGYGFVKGEDGREYLVYLTEVRGKPEDLVAGAKVEFDPVETRKGPQAADVKRVEIDRPDR